MSTLAAHGKTYDGDLLEKKRLKKGPWTSEEDEILEAYVKKHGEGNWNAVQNHSGLARCGKSCRLRWSNHLKPNLKKGPFTAEEQSKVIELHAKLGNKWSRMALELPGRTDNEIKNFWNTRRRKRERVGLPLYPPGIQLQALTKGNQENLNGSSQQADVSQGDKFDIPEVKFKKYKLSREHPSFTLPPIYDIRTSEQGSDSFHFPVMQPPKLLGDSNMLYNNSLGSTCISSTPSEMIDHDNIVQPPMLLGDSHTLYNSLDSTLTSSTPPELIDHDSDQFRGDCFSGGYACLSGTSSISGAMVSDLPPFPCVETHQSSSSCWGMPRPASPLPSFDEFFDTLIQYPPPPEQTQSEPPVSPHSSGLLESIFFPPKILEGSDATCMHSLEKGEPNPLEEENSNPRELTNPDALPDFGWLENDTPYDKDQCDIDGTLFGILFHGCRQRYL